MKNIANADFTISKEASQPFLAWFESQTGHRLVDPEGRLQPTEGGETLEKDEVISCASWREWDVNPDAETISLSIYDRSKASNMPTLDNLRITVGIELNKASPDDAVFGFFISDKIVEDSESATEAFARLLPDVVPLIDGLAAVGEEIPGH